MQFFENNKIDSDHIIYSTNLSFMFVNLRPFLPYHILASPKRIVERVSDLNKEELQDLFNCVQLATKVMKSLADGFTISIQDGKAAGQKVFHVHVHIVPRKFNDLENNDDVYKPGNLDFVRTDRSYVEMKEEADFLRQLFSQNVMN